ncbi:hypothetical protein BDV96DRAFT_640522 [Lophiotrema nucula]|uniref:Uncharacterized protein n=1 Tax=Lophiotrema nucula TaxID=690887 RepID=A0A6A5ZPF5_9PLEO|nr:hypothetical protein BDV96DRAFT_640522 [Lophiotrema nucula]
MPSVSKLIKAPEFQGFWIHILYGKVQTDASGTRYIATDPREHNLIRGSADVAKQFEKLVHLISFCLIPGDNTLKANALMSPSLWDLERYSQGEYLRLQLNIASLLGHEPAHAFWTLRMHPIMTVKRDEIADPYAYQSDPMPELGFAWDISVFSGILFQPPITNEMDVYSPMHSVEWGHVFAFPNIYAIVPTTKIQMWSYKDTWVDIRQALEDGRLRTPLVRDSPPLVIMYRYKDRKWRSILLVHGEEAPGSGGPFTPSPPKNVPLDHWYWHIIPSEIDQSLNEGVSKHEEFLVHGVQFISRDSKAQRRKYGVTTPTQLRT